MADLEIAGLSKRYGDFLAVADASLQVGQGEFLSLLGPSGCGKTTMLRMLCGLITPDTGQVRVGGEDITWRPVHKRNIGLVFQSYALFPHMSVFENVAFGLRRRGIDGPELNRRVGDALQLVRLGDLGKRFPRELSGGQQQRVALARAIAPRPALLLLDEPLSNLDAKLRDAMRIELRLLQRELGLTTVFVTHDQEEALTLSDRICVLHRGEIQQIGSPREIYDHPRTPFVAEFFGHSNRLDGHVRSLGPPLRVAADDIELRVGAVPQGLELTEGAPVCLVLRRESLRLSREYPSARAENCFAGTLRLSSFAGNTMIYVVRLANGLELNAERQARRGRDELAIGTEVYLSIEPDEIIVTGAGG